MKSPVRALCAALPVVFLAAAAEAQTFAPVGWYGTLGYSRLDGDQLTLGAVSGRVGARFGSYFGVEGEVNVGVNQDHFTYVPPCSGPICAIAIFRVKSRLSNSEGMYAVGYLPVAPDADLFVRAGYGFAHYSASQAFFNGFDEQSFNYGAGAQIFLDDANGLRLDYTRQAIAQDTRPGREAIGNNADVWSVSYVRRF